MRGLSALVIVGVILSLFAVGCEQKKEEAPAPKSAEGPRKFDPGLLAKSQPQEQQAQPQPQAPPQPQTRGDAGMANPHSDIPKASKTITVPETVKGQWKQVRLAVEDRQTKKTTEYKVKIGSEFSIPGTDLKVVVSEFLPDFTMDGNVITSKSNEPNNQAVRVEVIEKGKSIYKNWLYAKFPDIHKFEHERYGLTLKEGIRG